MLGLTRESEGNEEPARQSMFEHAEALPKQASSAARARRIVERLGGEVDAGTLADAKLLVSELIANAVEHVREPGPVGFVVAVRDGALRVEVRDAGPGFVPRPRHPGSPLSSGWGLHFVERLASRWAADRDRGGRVWFEIDLPARV